MKSNEMIEIPYEVHQELLDIERKYLLLKESYFIFLLALEEVKQTFLAS